MADDSSWTPKQDMSLLCRVCANQHDYLIPIFEGEGLDHDMPTKMDKHLPIKVRENDKLPTQMCYQCASTIIAWSELVTNCLEADKKLSRMLKINEKKAGTVALVDEDATSDHYEDAYDDVGGGDDYDDAAADDEDFEKEIKQLISDAGVELGSKTTKAKTTRATTRKRKSETVIVKKESKKSKTDTSVGKSSISLIKPKEEVTASDDRFTCHQCRGIRTTGCSCTKILFQCELCCFPFPSKSHLIKHLFLCQSDKDLELDKNKTIYQCPGCKMIFNGRDLFKSHLSTKSCDPWHKESFRKLKAKEASSRRQTFQSFHICGVCDKVFRTFREFKQHKKFEHSDIEMSCEKFNSYDECGKQYETLDSYRDIMRNVHKVVHNCSYCSKEYNSLREMKKHEKTEHSDLINRCEYCDKTFVHLKAHKLTHSNERPQYVCEICGRAFLAASNLKAHLRSHTKEKPYVCELCGNVYSQMGTLTHHKNAAHSIGEKRFKCSLCHLMFFKSSKYQRHLATHMNSPKLFQCDICDKKFKTQDYVRDHKKRVHNGRPHKCSLCSASFKVPYNLKMHKKTHYKVKN